MAVDAAVRKKAEKMQCLSSGDSLVNRIQKSGVLEKAPVLNGLCDAREFLVNNAARTDVCMADFTVSHLAVRQPYIQTGSADLCDGILMKQAVKVRLFGSLDCIAGVIAADAKTIHDDQD